MTIFTHGEVYFSGQAPRGLTWLSRPQRGLHELPKPLGFFHTKTHGEGIITTNIHNNVVNVNKAINDNIYTWGSVFIGSSTSWANMVVKASKRAYMSRQSHSGFAVLKHTGRE